MNPNPGMVYVDFRESRSQVPKFLSKLGVEFKMADLPADYEIGKDCLVERKTITDFITSIGDGRLFRQVADLSNNYANPLLLLEGGGLYQNCRVSANIIRGIMLWITVRKKVPLLRTFNEYDTACTLRLLARKSSYLNSGNPEPFKHPRKIISPWQQQIKILTQIPGVGRQTAKELLKFCGSVSVMSQLSDNQLICMPGLGKERLKNIRQIFPCQPPDPALSIPQA